MGARVRKQDSRRVPRWAQRKRREPVNGETIITVLLADDHAGVRGAIRGVLERAPLLKVTGEAADGAAAVRLARELEPDLVLMDLGMPGLSGIEATRLIVAATQSRVIMLSLQGERQSVIESMPVSAPSPRPKRA